MVERLTAGGEREGSWLWGHNHQREGARRKTSFFSEVLSNAMLQPLKRFGKLTIYRPDENAAFSLIQ